mmetsp:Transcript_1997/g.6148  ORF Transcript_1997/g.6148 Transcript_1997/m.6148 type:complete len:364 (-) Transcript_1997:148-1239(-)
MSTCTLICACIRASLSASTAICILTSCWQLSGMCISVCSSNRRRQGCSRTCADVSRSAGSTCNKPLTSSMASFETKLHTFASNLFRKLPVKTSSTVSKGISPLNKLKRRIPVDQRSTAAVYRSFLIISGAANSSVPHAVDMSFSCSRSLSVASIFSALSCLRTLARPKSAIFMTSLPGSIRRMFCGLMSRCTMPFSCKKRSESTSCNTIEHDSCSLKAELLLKIARNSSPPGAYSVTNMTDVSVSNTSCSCKRPLWPWQRINILISWLINSLSAAVSALSSSSSDVLTVFCLPKFARSSALGLRLCLAELGSPEELPSSEDWPPSEPWCCTTVPSLVQVDEYAARRSFRMNLTATCSPVARLR